MSPTSKNNLNNFELVKQMSASNMKISRKSPPNDTHGPFKKTHKADESVNVLRFTRSNKKKSVDLKAHLKCTRCLSDV